MNQVRPITDEILTAFLARMAPDARADLDDMTGHQAEAHMTRVVDMCVHTFAGIVDGNPAFIGGVIPDGAHGHVWMLATPDVARAKKFYLRVTREQRDIMAGMFSTLRTQVATECGKSLRWLDWLGFHIGAPQPMGIRTVHRVEFSHV